MAFSVPVRGTMMNKGEEAFSKCGELMQRCEDLSLDWGLFCVYLKGLCCVVILRVTTRGVGAAV